MNDIVCVGELSQLQLIFNSQKIAVKDKFKISNMTFDLTKAVKINHFWIYMKKEDITYG